MDSFPSVHLGREGNNFRGRGCILAKLLLTTEEPYTHIVSSSSDGPASNSFDRIHRHAARRHAQLGLMLAYESSSGGENRLQRVTVGERRIL